MGAGHSEQGTWSKGCNVGGENRIPTSLRETIIDLHDSLVDHYTVPTEKYFLGYAAVLRSTFHFAHPVVRKSQNSSFRVLVQRDFLKFKFRCRRNKFRFPVKAYGRPESFVGRG